MRMMRAAESVPSRPASRSAPIVRYEAREHYPIALLGGAAAPPCPYLATPLRMHRVIQVSVANRLIQKFSMVTLESS
jgi:hypothetical protein